MGTGVRFEIKRFVLCLSNLYRYFLTLKHFLHFIVLVLGSGINHMIFRPDLKFSPANRYRRCLLLLSGKFCLRTGAGSRRGPPGTGTGIRFRVKTGCMLLRVPVPVPNGQTFNFYSVLLTINWNRHLFCVTTGCKPVIVPVPVLNGQLLKFIREFFILYHVLCETLIARY
jgi:hypothetical protein